MLDELPAEFGPIRDRDLNTASCAKSHAQPTASGHDLPSSCHAEVPRQYKVLLLHTTIDAVHLPARPQLPNAVLVPHLTPCALFRNCGTQYRCTEMHALCPLNHLLID